MDPIENLNSATSMYKQSSIYHTYHTIHGPFNNAFHYHNKRKLPLFLPFISDAIPTIFIYHYSNHTKIRGNHNMWKTDKKLRNEGDYNDVN